MTEFEDLVDGAQEWFDTAQEALSAGRLYAAFESFRHATELACKALLLRATGGFPRDHAVAGALAAAGLVPERVSARDLHRLLASHTRGTYGFHQAIHRRDVEAAARLALRMLEHVAEN